MKSSFSTVDQRINLSATTQSISQTKQLISQPLKEGGEEEEEEEKIANHQLDFLRKDMARTGTFKDIS